MEFSASGTGNSGNYPFISEGWWELDWSYSCNGNFFVEAGGQMLVSQSGPQGSGTNYWTYGNSPLKVVSTCPWQITVSSHRNDYQQSIVSRHWTDADTYSFQMPGAAGGMASFEYFTANMCSTSSTGGDGWDIFDQTTQQHFWTNIVNDGGASWVDTGGFRSGDTMLLTFEGSCPIDASITYQ